MCKILNGRLIFRKKKKKLKKELVWTVEKKKLYLVYNYRLGILYFLFCFLTLQYARSSYKLGDNNKFI